MTQKNRLALSLLLTLSVLFISCSTPIHTKSVDVEIDTYGRINGPGTFKLIQGRGMEVSELEFEELSRSLRQGLMSRGYQEVYENPSYTIEFSYAVSDPISKNVTREIPIYENRPSTPSNSNQQQHSTTSRTQGTLKTDGFGNVNIDTTTTTTPTVLAEFRPGSVDIPTYVGSRTEVKQFVVFESLVHIQVFRGDVSNLDEIENEFLIWEAKIHSVGLSNDLRYLMPHFFKQVLEFWGESTGKKITRSVTLD